MIAGLLWSLCAVGAEAQNPGERNGPASPAPAAVVAAAPLTCVRETAAVAPAVKDTARAGATRAAPARSLLAVVFRGLIGVTAFMQDGPMGFGNGQSALWVKPQQPASNGSLMGADIRNTRLGMSAGGGELAPGVHAGGMVEMDFFGGFSGSSASSAEQPLPRLRLAYVDLTRGNTMVRVGQFWVPIAGDFAASLSHIAYPLGLGSAGVIGWRNPGVLVQQQLLTSPKRPKLSAQLAAFRGSWSGPGDPLDQLSGGETSLIPQLEGRLDLVSGSRWSVYAAGHFDRKDLSGLGPDTANLGTLDGEAAELGGRLVAGRLNIAGNAYVGRAIGQQMGELAQWGDAGSRGAWGQAGFNVTPAVSVWGFAGGAKVDQDEAKKAFKGDVRLSNRLLVGMVQYARGGYAAGAEWLRARTTFGNVASSSRTWSHTANQLAFSVEYRFSSQP